MQPYNYSIGEVGNTFDSALKGYSTALGLQDQQAKRQDAERSRQLSMQMQQDLGAFSKLPNPTAQDYSRLMTMYPQLSEQFKRNFDVLERGQQQDALSHATQVYSAMRAGQPDAADSLLAQREQAERNSGRTKEADAIKAQREIMKMNPTAATNTAGLFLSSALGADKFAAAFPAISGEQRNQELQPSALRKSVAEAGKSEEELARSRMQTQTEQPLLSAKLRKEQADAAVREEEAKGAPDRVLLENLKRVADAEKIAADIADIKAKVGDLPQHIEKEVSTNLADSNSKTTQSRRALDLATRIQALNSTGGLATRGFNAAMKALGAQGDEQQIRQEYNRLRTTEVVRMLPPGPASDRDIQIIQAGFPDENADPAYIAEFLKTTARLLAVEAASSRANGLWTAENRGFGPAKRQMVIDGILVDRGSNPIDFAQSYIKQKELDYQAQNSLRQAQDQQRGYLRHGAQTPPRSGASGRF